MRKRWLEAVTGILAAAFFTNAAPSGLVVSRPYLRLVGGGNPAAGYFTMMNHGREPAVLTGAHSVDCFSGLVMQKSSTVGGVAHIDDVKAVVIAHGQRLAFAPGGYQLTCMDTSLRLQLGGATKITLKFLGGGHLDVTFRVGAPGGLQ